MMTIIGIESLAVAAAATSTCAVVAIPERPTPEEQRLYERLRALRAKQ